MKVAKLIFTISLGSGIYFAPTADAGPLECYHAEATTAVSLSSALDEGSSIISISAIPAATVAGAAPPALESVTYADLEDAAAMKTSASVFDSKGASHGVTILYFHTASQAYEVRGFVDSNEVDPSGSSKGFPRRIFSSTLTFDGSGMRNNFSSAPEVISAIPWINGADPSSIGFDFADVVLQPNAAANNFAANGHAPLGNPDFDLGTLLGDADSPRIFIAANFNGDAAVVTYSSIPAAPSAGSSAPATETVTFENLAATSMLHYVQEILDSENELKKLIFYFFSTATNEITGRIYIDSAEVDPDPAHTGFPRHLSSFTLFFDGDGSRNPSPVNGVADAIFSVPWNNGREESQISVSIPGSSNLVGPSSICFAQVDYCPADPARNYPGKCGCGKSEADKNGDGIPDCFDDISFLSPDRPEITRHAGTTFIEMQRFEGRVTYHLVLTDSRGTTSNFETRSRRWNAGALARGTWRIQYLVVSGSGRRELRGRLSPAVRFSIR